MYYDHSTCMYHGHSTCMWYEKSTDWYNETGDPDEYKITVRFLSNEIRSDSIKIITHKP